MSRTVKVIFIVLALVSALDLRAGKKAWLNFKAVAAGLIED
jgi:hypothetical protein